MRMIGWQATRSKQQSSSVAVKAKTAMRLLLHKKKITARISEMGFEAYVAVQEQTLRGIKENVFSNSTHT
jgi:hypothetical protein